MTEQKILASAKNEFMRLGFHSATVRQIAKNAEVNRTVVHYYFRSKEKLYGLIVSEMTPMLSGLNFPKDERSSYLWFILIELKTNRSHFISTLERNGYTEWNSIIEKSVLQEFIKIGVSQF